MRMVDITQELQIGHDIPDCRGAQVQAIPLGYIARADRRSCLDEAVNNAPQYCSFPFVQAFGHYCPYRCAKTIIPV